MNKFITAFFLILFTLSCTDSVNNPLVNNINYGNQIGNNFPEGIIFKTIDEKNTVKLEDFKGKVILVDYWENWCGYCRAGMPKIIELYEKYKNSGLVVITISATSNLQNTIDLKMQNLINLKDDYLINDNGSLFSYSSYYKITTLPRILIYDKTGKLIYNSFAYYADIEVFIKKQL